MDRSRAIGVAFVVVSAFSFGSGAVFAKPVYASGLDWLTLLAWRFLIGAALGWAWLLASPVRRAGLRRLSRRSVAIALGLGLFYLGNSATYFAALETVPASLAALIVYVYPRPRGGARAPLRSAARGTARVGCTRHRARRRRARRRRHRCVERTARDGLILTMASPVIYSAWIIMSARLSGERSDRVGAEDDAGAEAASATALMMTATAVAFWFIAAASGRPLAPADIPSAAWPGLLGVGAISTFLSIQTFYVGTRRLGAAQAALISTVEPVWTISLAALLFGELLAPIQLAGGVLILAGVILAQTSPGSARGALRTVLRVADE